MDDPMLSMNERLALDGGRWFGALSPTLRHDILRHGRVRRFADGERIFARGEPARSWGAVAHGVVRVSSSAACGRQLTLCYMRAGLWFSDAAALDGEPRSYDAHAHGAVTMLLLERDDVQNILRQHVELYGALLRLHARRTRQLFQLLEDLQTLSLRARIAKQLSALARRHPIPSLAHPGEIRIGLPLAQDELAQLVGASRQRVNRELKDLRAAGLIRVEPRRLVVCDLPGLQWIAQDREPAPTLQDEGASAYAAPHAWQPRQQPTRHEAGSYMA